MRLESVRDRRAERGPSLGPPLCAPRRLGYRRPVRNREQLGEGASDIWFGPTEGGEASAVNPPDYVRKFWRMPEPDAS